MGCDIDYVIMDFDMKKINKIKEFLEIISGYVLVSYCNFVFSRSIMYKVCIVYKFVIMCMRSTLC